MPIAGKHCKHNASNTQRRMHMYDKPIYEGRLTLSEVFLEVRIITKKPTRPHSIDDMARGDTPS